MKKFPLCLKALNRHMADMMTRRCDVAWRTMAAIGATGWLAWGPTNTAIAQTGHNVFGEKTASEAALIGIFYDLKQTQDGRPTNVTVGQYWEILDDFFSKGWDESVLNQYYRAMQPRFTTQIFVPAIPADTAPKAFGVRPNVKPSRWVIHYKGQIPPPQSGTYRFWGSGDDILAVALDGKMMLLKPWGGEARIDFPKTKWKRDKQTNPFGVKTLNNRIQAGDWMELNSNRIYNLDVIIGERPGGLCDAFLLVEKQGEHYEMTPEGPILPIFQVAPYDTPVPNLPKHAPLFTTGGPVWKSYQ
jgi:hypothetical protein